MGRITLFQQSLRNPDTTIQVQQGAAGAGLAALGGGLDVLSQAGQRAADLTAQRDLAVQQAARSQTLADTRVKALGELNDLRLKYANDSDPATMQTRWQADSQAVKEKYVAGLGEDPGLKADFANEFDQWQMRDKVDISTDATRKISTIGRAKLEQNLSDLSGLMSQTDDPVRSEQLKATAATSIGDAVKAGYLNQVEAGDMQRGLYRDVDRAKAMTMIDQDPRAALTALQDGGRFTGLEPTDRPQLVNQAQAEIKRQEAEAKAAAAEARIQRQTDVALRFDDALTNASLNGRQAILGNDEILAAYPGRQGQQMIDRLNEAAQEGTDRIQVSSQSIADDQKMLDGLRPQQGAETTADALKRYQSIAAAVDQKQQALSTDPAGYVAANNQAVKSAWAAVGAVDQNDQAGRDAAVKKAVAASRQAQLDLGLTADQVRVLPAAQAASLASQVNGLPPSERGAFVQQALNLYGLGGVKEIEAHGAPRTLRSLVTVDNPIWQSDLAKAQDLGKDLDPLVKARGVKTGELDDKVEEAWAPFAATLPPSSAAPYLEAIKQVARMKVANGATLDDAVNATLQPFNDGFTVQDGYRVPASFSAGKVSSGLAAITQNLGKLDIAPAQSADPHLDEAYRQKETLRSLQQGHYRWLTNENGDGVVMTFEDGQPVTRKDGSRLEFSFKDLVAGKYGAVTKRGGRLGLPMPQGNE